MQPEVAQRFDALWTSNDSPPDVFEFLTRCGDANMVEIVAVIVQDQRHRWRTDKPLSVEDYLARLPALAADPRQKLELAVGEFRARMAGDDWPEVTDFTSRFADISDSLRSKLSALESANEVTAEISPDHHTMSQHTPADLEVTFISESDVVEHTGVRYRPERILGEGGYGRVYLAFDTQLRRQVAVKVPAPSRFKKPEHAEMYLAEARTVARLDHPNVVPVYDMGRTDDGSIFVVSKFIEGCTLRERMRNDFPSPGESATLLATVALGLHHAHQRRIVHRDIKPGNILIEQSTGIAYVTDFGLAIREEDIFEDNRIVGTPAYMSPEQARGEGHRLDGRSDIFSLGAVLYELLTRRRPFRGSTQNEILHEVVSVEPRNPRNIDESIPAELERICLKALSKRASDRYADATKFADDLLDWQDDIHPEAREVQIVPKGLRSFDAQDADFFLELLPGPRARDGLPEDIRFWKTRIEETDPEKTFTVGLIYGPSGCGKSSLVKAGLLPRISPSVTTIYLEATPEETELRILRGLRKHIPELPRDLELVETFSWLRRREQGKVVIVLDQFEQWLHSNRAELDFTLVSALRQCDGGRLQAIVMVRDDFSMAASRFMRELETRILEGHNFETIDLFDVTHAAKVLVKFGQAFGKLPQCGMLTPPQQQFVDAVASGLAVDGKVVSVRLALFAEMVKAKPWLPVTLREVGGTEGVGANFLEEMFGGRNANPDHLHHQHAARTVLMSLLPEVGSDIKGHMRSHAELLDVSNYQRRPREFNELLRILDGKLRLITPTDPAEFHSGSAGDPNLKFYQLTHDYMVPSLRKWLTRKQQETRRGRAEIKLGERFAVWDAKPESRHLPSLWEWASIEWLTDKKNWNPPQRRMMEIAARVHGVRLATVVGLLLTIVIGGLHVRDRVLSANREHRAAGFVTAIAHAKIEQLPAILDQMRPDREWVEPRLAEAVPDFDPHSNERLNLSLAMLSSDPTQLEYLTDRLLDARPEQIETIRELLFRDRESLVPELWRVAQQASDGRSDQLLQAVSSLAIYDVENDEQWKSVASNVVEALVGENSIRVATWVRALAPARDYLIEPLCDVYRADLKSRPQSQVDQATDILEEYAVDDVGLLAELIFAGQPAQFVALFDEFAAFGDEANVELEAELARQNTIFWDDAELDARRVDPAPEVIARIEQCDGMVADRFAMCQTLPLHELQGITEALRNSGYRPIRLRPYNHPDAIRVAVVWTRDNLDWRLLIDQTSKVLDERDDELRREGFIPVDVAGYLGAVGSIDAYAAVWRKRGGEIDDARMFANVPHADVTSTQNTLQQTGFAHAQSLQAFRGTTGHRTYCGVVTNQPESTTVLLSQAQSVFQTQDFHERILTDIDLGLAHELPSLRVRSLGELKEAEKRVLEDDANLDARLARGSARMRLDRNVIALADFNFVIDQLAANREDDIPPEKLTEIICEAYRCRSILHARIGKADEARSEFAEFVRRNESASAAVSLDAILAAHLGDDNAAVQRMEAFIDEKATDAESLYDAAKAFAILAGIHREPDIARSKVCAQRSVSLLREAIENGFNDFSRLQLDSGFEPIIDSRGFSDVMRLGHPDLRYAAVWDVSARFSARHSHGLSPSEHLKQCQEFRDEGYRIVSLSVVFDRDDALTASVWHRPLIPDAASEKLARRKANAAVAALRMGETESVWPLLKQNADPRLRTWILHRLSRMEVPPTIVTERLANESDPSIRQALLLALGLYEKSPRIDRETLTQTLTQWYRTDADPAVHSAVEWVLRRWERVPKLDTGKSKAQMDKSASKSERWFVTPSGITMVAIPGPKEFLMGSPPSQRGRSSDEYLHRHRINHSYAIALHETTVGQFRDFLQHSSGIDHSYTQKDAPGDDCPQTSVTWYEAAAYCRWLSDQEDLPENQMCYPPIDQIEQGMVLPRDYLTRIGYRLPTEAEWEFACGANTTTRRYYGDADELLDRYAWYSQNSDDRTWPVGSLIPNDFGLFDMHGNVQEWCQEHHLDYSRLLGTLSEDREDIKTIMNSNRRVLRGGSFGLRPTELRTAARSYNRPANRYNNSGFRLVRSY